MKAQCYVSQRIPCTVPRYICWFACPVNNIILCLKHMYIYIYIYIYIWKYICRVQKPGHTTVGAARRAAGRRGGAGTGRVGRRRVGSPRTQPFLLLCRQSKKTLLGVSLEARTVEFPCKPMEEQSQRFICGATSALRSWPLPVYHYNVA